TNWTVCATNSGFFTAANRNETRSWLATNASSFNAFRLNVLGNNGGAEVQLSELQLYQFNSLSLPWTETSAGFRGWWPIACSADGTNVLAGVSSDGDQLWRSTNAGFSWQRLPGS